MSPLKAFAITVLVGFAIHQIVNLKLVGVRDVQRLKPSNQGVTLK